MKRNLIVTIALFALLCSVAKAQFSADVDGSLDVANVNGNLTYTYPISNNSIDGFPLKVDLNFVANAPYTIFGYYHKPDNYWQKFSYSQPAWIMGVNGFAINVLKRNNSFVKTVPKNLSGNSIITGNDYEALEILNTRYNFVNLPNELIEGYDYCNRMMQLTVFAAHQDIIKLLRSDGSVLELRNKNVMASGEPSNYTGYYYENGVNPEGFAIVEYDTTTNFPTWIKNEFDNLPNRWAYLPRVVRYYRGDGLEYVFREVVIPYGFRYKFKNIGIGDSILCGSRAIRDPKDTTKWITVPLYNVGYTATPADVTPTIFYLEEINSDLKNIATFERKWHNFKEEEVSINRGRSYINKFANHIIDINEEENNMTIQVFDRTLHLNLTSQNGLLDVSSPPIINYKFNSIIEDINTHSELNGDYSNSLIYFVTKIIDASGRKTNFKYNGDIYKSYGQV
ncbi:MAG TPA: hypothetical protein PK762_11740, partial [Candidatus Kapabacteria bacterium]|nr:hypothetical protein [Candidatus Kapabacteria bacterium]